MTKKQANSIFAALLLIICLFANSMLYAQNKKLHQTISGFVYDSASGQALQDVSIVIMGSYPISTKTNMDGKFILENIPIGRYELRISFTGYESQIIKEVLVGSVHQVYIEVPMYENAITLQEVESKPKTLHAKPINPFTVVGGNTFSPEQASRFAGGMDDPARLVSSNAGVTTSSMSSNGLSIRGNAPSLLQWRLEGVEIPSPNHFSDINGLGGGLLCAVSNNVIGNSDFLIGSFPAEYNNAISGVFDIKMRKGNRKLYHHSFQLGLLGIDVASEGPISKSSNATYIINYRYSTTGLLEKIRKDENIGGKLGYQDLNFNLNFPTKKSGVFSIWGLGLVDNVAPILDQSTNRKYLDDGVLSAAEQKAGATGLSHHYFLKNNKTSLKSTFATTYSSNHIHEDFYDIENHKSPKTDLTYNTTNLIFSSTLQHKFHPNHINKTGVTLTNIHHNIHVDHTPYYGQQLINFAHSNSHTNMISAYSNSKIKISNDFTVVGGFNVQHFILNKNTVAEPRVGVNWDALPGRSISAAYGLHSRIERPDVYFFKNNEEELINRNLAFLKSHQFTVGYNQELTSDLYLKIELYFQLLYDVPIAPIGNYSILNRTDFYTTQSLISKGKGKNLGVDLTLSKSFKKGYYYLLTTSLFDSKYKAADDKWYNTRFNRNYVFNFLVGKEWIFGSNILGVNFKASKLGGQRYSPVDEAATLLHPDKEVQYDENRMFEKQLRSMFIGDLTLSYKMNRGRFSHTFAIKSVNATKQKEFIKHKFNIMTQTIEPYFAANSLFNVSYRIDL
ncbi:TonB-dependent receptor [Sphingobacterium kitahiroshimense]|uniref:TonB-dependent receptor n=1 Tax=Sphingobacterium sp. B16(2022) TaxID=2914044 RepID=UPI00143B6210|nr:TonB-dependent receptor [Sphingobacterium sp. B16(2022)]NJI72658.1 TonB-dependent receptor [Sphingobacterium sp. B16(2022)]